MAELFHSMVQMVGALLLLAFALIAVLIRAIVTVLVIAMFAIIILSPFIFIGWLIVR